MIEISTFQVLKRTLSKTSFGGLIVLKLKSPKMQVHFERVQIRIKQKSTYIDLSYIQAAVFI